MKKLAAVLCLSTLTTGTFAQGLINFFNNPSTLISVGPPGVPGVMPANNAGAYYFGLLIAPVGSTAFTFANVYGTNQSVAGRFTGGNGVPVPGWAAGVTMQYEIVGWSADLGATFNASWLTQFPTSAPFGFSGIGTGAAGGATATGTLPNFNLFGGTGLTSGFAMALIPEPSSMALTGLGAAALLICRRRKTIRASLTKLSLRKRGGQSRDAERKRRGDRSCSIFRGRKRWWNCGRNVGADERQSMQGVHRDSWSSRHRPETAWTEAGAAAGRREIGPSATPLSSNQNRLPLDGSDSTPTLPPMWVTTLRTRASPSPVPS
jgi:hypothetical protein